MFEFLFKYSRIVYKEGVWAFRSLPAPVWVAAGLLAVFSLFLLIYRRTAMPTPVAFRSFLATLKVAAIGLLLLALAEPFISITTIVPKKGTVLILIDDSQSMQIADERPDVRRIDQVKQWLGPADGAGVQKQLAEKFNLLLYRFAEMPAPLVHIDSLRPTGRITDLARALQFADQLRKSYAISSVILVTDGVQTRQADATAGDANTLTDPLQAAALLRSAGIPVYTIGTGSEIKNDIQLTSVSTSRSVTENDLLEMTALIHSRIADSRKVRFELLEGDRVIDARDVILQSKYNRVTFTHKPGRKGHLQYTAHIVPSADEIITVNNSRHFLVNNEEKIARVLYVEELHPWDFKFIKRAIDLDKSLQLVSLLRTGPDKFYRQGIRNQRELEQGFPSSKNELFSYQAVIIGSIDAAFLTAEQQAMLREFVSERGGGLLMLGGPKSFSQGGWQHTSVAEVLPVELLPDAEAAKHYANPLRSKAFRLQLTPEGYRSPVLQFSTDEQTNRRLWDEMPELRGYNPVGAARPGATVLAVHPLSQPEREKIIIAQQRYGRGRTMVLATSSTWLWQMHLDASDLRHETFWRQIVRWLALSTPDPVEVTLDRDNYNPGQTVALYINALDSSFSPVRNAQISVRISTPANDDSAGGASGRGDPPVGAIQLIEALPDLSKPGEYRAQFVPDREGLYEVEVQATEPTGKFLGRSTASFYVSENHVEFASPDLQVGLLERIAEISGGKYLHISAANDLADELAVARSTYSKTVERDLWDMPALYFAILLLLAAEWIARRARGLS